MNEVLIGMLVELDRHCADRVMGWQEARSVDGVPRYGEWAATSGEVILHNSLAFRPTRDPADAFAVLKKCAERLANSGGITLEPFDGGWRIRWRKNGELQSIHGRFMEYTICLAAREIFH